MRVEEILTRELREVADHLAVPALPPLPQQSPRALRRWQPLLVAATVVLFAAGAVAGVLAFLDSRGTTSPAPPVAPSPAGTPTDSPTGTPTETPTGTPSEPSDEPSAETAAGWPTPRPLAADAPTVPFLFDGRLYVAGNQLSGSWWQLTHAGDTWVAQRDDETWWWGVDAEPHAALPGETIRSADISPDGALLAFTIQDGGQVVLLNTRSGDTVNTLEIGTVGDAGPDVLGVDAVTDDARVLLSSETESVMWLADEDETVGLDTVASNQWVQGNSPAGLIVLGESRDGEGDAAYLAEVSDSGTLTQSNTLPNSEVVLNPSGTWLAYGGSWGGESEVIPEITAQTIDASRQLALQPPDERPLVPITWEDDGLLLAQLHGGDGGPTGLARCSVSEERCWVIDVP